MQLGNSITAGEMDKFGNGGRRSGGGVTWSMKEPLEGAISQQTTLLRLRFTALPLIYNDAIFREMLAKMAAE